MTATLRRPAGDGNSRRGSLFALVAALHGQPHLTFEGLDVMKGMSRSVETLGSDIALVFFAPRLEAGALRVGAAGDATAVP